MHPIVTFEMEDGSVFRAELYPELAPNTVNNFLSLVKKGFYDGIIFHRVNRRLHDPGRGPQGRRHGRPRLPHQRGVQSNGVENPVKHERGVLSMARAQHPDSAGSQFFVMHAAAPYLDGQYAAFGKVIEGMETVDAIATTPTDFRDKPLKEQRMKKVTAETFGESYPEPEKIV